MSAAAIRLGRAAAVFGFAWIVLLAGCARSPLRQDGPSLWVEQARREAALAGWDQWRLVGRIAVSGEGEGGSGRIEWLQRGEAFSIELSAPVSRKSWRLSSGSGVARLEGSEGGVLQGDNAEALLREAAGWSMPIDLLRAWVLGARAAGAAQLEFGPDGLPARLHQAEWHIEYRNWGQFRGVPVPVRIFAESGTRRVRLIVDRWELLRE